MKHYWNTFRQFHPNILRYMFYWAMISFAYFGIVGVLLNLYLLRLGYDTEFIGLVHGAGQMAWAAFALPAGMVGARTGAKQAMTAGMAVMAAGIGLLLFAELLPQDLRQAGLLVSWMITWVGAALGVVNSAPYLMAITDEKTRGFAFSAQQTVMAAAGFTGSVAAGFLPGMIAGQIGLALDHPAPYRLALILAPAAYFFGMLVFSRSTPVVQQIQTKKIEETSQRPFRLFLFLGVVIALQAFSEGTVRAFFNVYLDTDLNVSTGQIGGIMGASQLMLILISLAVPAVLARWGSRGTFTRTTFGLVLFILLLAAVRFEAVAAGAYTGITGILMIIATARGIYSQEVVLPRWRTTISAISTVGLALGLAVAAWLGGILVRSIGFQGIFLLGAFTALLSAGLLSIQKNRSTVGTPKEHVAIPEKAAVIAPVEAEEPC